MSRNRVKLRRVFVGQNGIRAGWSMLIFALLLVFPGVALTFVIHHFHSGQSKTVSPRSILIGEAIGFALVLGATAIMAWIEQRSVWSYGLRGPRLLANFAVGCVGGLVTLSAVVGELYLGGFLAFGGLALHGLPILGYGLAWLLAFCLVGLTEEMLFRGYLQSTIARGMGFWPGAVVMSIVFAAAHLANSGETIPGIVMVVIAGLSLCLLLRVSGSLWLGIGFHATWDWAQSYLYGTPDSAMLMQGHLLITHATGNVILSGGTAGPEGSILGPFAFAAGPLILVWLGRRAGLFAAPATIPPPPGVIPSPDTPEPRLP